MTLHVKDGGTWKEVTNLYVKDSNTWKEVTSGQVKDAGSWKEFKTTGGGGGGYTYLIQASTASTGSNTSTMTLALNGTGGVSWNWTVTSAGSSPGGFYSSHSVSAPSDGFGTVTLTSNCQNASPGTRILLNYDVSCVTGSGTVEPTYVQVVHQF